MKVILAFTRIALHNTYIYRFAFWARLFTYFVMMYAMYSLWRVLYAQIPDAFGMDLQTMTTYGVLGIILMPIIGSVLVCQLYISERVRMGTFELDLMKPLNFIFQMFCRSLGEFWVWTLAYGIPCSIFAGLFLDFSPPANLEAGLAFVLSIVLGFLVQFCIQMLIGMLSIATLDIRSFRWVFWALIRFASGIAVPLWMYPPFLERIVSFLPFKDIYFTPMAIYVGVYEGNWINPIISQAIWVIVLFITLQIVWGRAQRRIVIQGG